VRAVQRSSCVWGNEPAEECDSERRFGTQDCCPVPMDGEHAEENRFVPTFLRAGKEGE
jgi:hypothetical protein